MNTTELKNKLKTGGLDARLTALYGSEALAAQKARYEKAIAEFEALYGTGREAHLFSVAGRSELSGNHTDHNHGCVVAASIDLDIIAVASPSEKNTVRVKSEGFPEDVVDLTDYTAPRADRFSHSDSIIAGMRAGFRKEGYAVGGFDHLQRAERLRAFLLRRV